MSLNLDKVGRFLCKVEGGKYNNKIVSVVSTSADEKDEYTKPFTSLTLTDGKFQQVPDPETERQILYITGASGSGKSTYTANYIKNYQKMFPERPIYCFSALKDDESLDVVKPQRIIIDDSIWKDPIDVAEFKNSLVVLDDIDVISDKKQRDAVYNIMNQILEVGRHFKITCIITNHLPTSGKDTRRVINECHSITYFPHSGTARGIKYLMIEYLGLDKRQLKKIKGLKSRWATIFKNYPNVIMCEKDIWLSANDDE
jgi:Tfp pilus assembly ATPase PilU